MSNRRGPRQITLTPESYESHQTWGEILENLQEELHTENIEMVCRRKSPHDDSKFMKSLFTIKSVPEESEHLEPETSHQTRMKTPLELAKARAEHHQKQYEDMKTK